MKLETHRDMNAGDATAPGTQRQSSTAPASRAPNRPTRSAVLLSLLLLIYCDVALTGA